jgi:Uncharacterised protein family (UPF0158)
MALDLSDLEMALEFVSTGYDSAAYLDKETGYIYYDSDEELPEDLHENEKYLEIPDKREFDLGRDLALDFAKNSIPDDFEHVYAIFRSEGAYSRYKILLEKRDMLQKWYDFEQESIKSALTQWCKENGIEVSS